MAKLLIVGDSFAVDCGAKTTVCGWPVRLAQHYVTTNLAQAGCGQYKIYKQLHSVNYHDFDCILIWHTSPYRIHVLENPIHKGDLLHNHADFIYSDIEYHANTDQSLRPIMDWFNRYFDLEYADFVYSLICDRMLNDLMDFKGKVIHCVCQPDVYEKLCHQKYFLNFWHLFEPNTLAVRANHFDQNTNDLVYQTIIKSL